MGFKNRRYAMNREEKKCKIQGCKRPYRAKGYCVTHYKEWRRGNLPKPRFSWCIKPECKNKAVYGKVCADHYKGLKKNKPAGAATQPQQ